MFRAFLALAIALAMPASALAQTLSIGGLEPLTLSISPSAPRPYEEVTVTVASTLINLAAANISITANGAAIGSGGRTATVRMGGPGTQTTIRATATLPEGAYAAAMTVAPADVSLIVEADSTAPAFYLGAKLVPSESRLRIIAIPDIRTAPGTRVPNDQLVFRWRVGDRLLEAESGIGRNVLVATAPPRYRDARVSVSVETRDQAVTGSASVAIAPIDPIVRVYRHDPLQGTWFSRALIEPFLLPGAEESFRAVPFFFRETPSFAWTLGGAAAGSAEILTVRTSGGSGTTVLAAKASTDDASASASAQLRFEASSSGLFGF